MAATLAAAVCLSGGAAYAATGGWPAITALWGQLPAVHGPVRAEQPVLVATSTAAGEQVSLWQASNDDGGECLAFQVGEDAPSGGCSGGVQTRPTYNVDAAPLDGLDLAGTWVLYGRFTPPTEVAQVSASLPGGSRRVAAVDAKSGAWILAVPAADVQATVLTAHDDTGADLGKHTVSGGGDFEVTP